MLRKIFETETISYRPPPSHFCSLLSSNYRETHSIIEPYMERIFQLGGLFAYPAPNPDSPYSIFSVIHIYTVEWPGWGSMLMRWNAATGERWPAGVVWYGDTNCSAYVFWDHPGRIPMQSNIGTLLAFGANSTLSRTGQPWFQDLWGTTIMRTTLSLHAISSETEDVPPSYPGIFATDDEIGASEFGFVVFGAFAIDEIEDVFIHGYTNTLTMYRLSTKEELYSKTMPTNIVDIALQDERYCYILMANRVLILFDYMRGEALGSTKIPPNPGGNPVEASTNIKIAWDPFFRRILVMEQTADNIDGSPTTQVIGYKLIPIPTRITVPVPLRVPRQGEQIPVLVQVVGDSNEGVGGYVVQATVSGSASLASAPITDQNGNAILTLACEGHVRFSGSDDAMDTGSPDADPSHAGLVEIETLVYVPADSTEIL